MIGIYERSRAVAMSPRLDISFSECSFARVASSGGYNWAPCSGEWSESGQGQGTNPLPRESVARAGCGLDGANHVIERR
jgi:hypothetical protein